jgi:hypothetical protein
MDKARKISLVINQIHPDNEDKLDVEFWMSKTASERLAEVYRLRVNYYKWLNGSYPDKIERVITQRKL